MLPKFQINLPDYAGWVFRRMLITDDPNKIFLTLKGVDYLYATISYRFNTGDVGLHYITSKLGHLLLTPDGKTIIGTQPRDIIGPPDPLWKGTVYFIDVDNEVITDEAVVPILDRFSRLNPSDGAISPDGRIAVFSTVQSAGIHYSVLDVQEKAFVDYDVLTSMDGVHRALMVSCKRDP